MRTVPVAAAGWVAPVLAGPVRRFRVVAVFRSAVLIAEDAGTQAGTDLLALLAPGAARVPVGVQLVGPLPGPALGDPVLIGENSVRVDDTRCLLTRAWRSSVPRITPGPGVLSQFCAFTAAAELGTDPGYLDDLVAATTAGDDPAGPVRALIGRGLGSTPAGDDMLAGLLVGWHATGRGELVGRLEPEVVAALVAARTVPYSAALLRAALAGHASAEVLAVLRALHRPTMIMEPAARLLSTGHTSGADLAAGLRAGLAPATLGARRPGGRHSGRSVHRKRSWETA